MKKQDSYESQSATTPSRGSFSGSLGYILSVAGSAVGLGNIWRFPYLAAKYGGGIFLLIYLILMITFGYTLMISETAMGRMTGKSPIGAFNKFGEKFFFQFGGWINAIIPMLIVPYYSVIGGWVAKYLFEYLKGNSSNLASETYFSNFLSSSYSLTSWFIIFSILVFVVVIFGVKNGVEKVSTIMMPSLIILALLIAGYSVTRPGALAGLKYLLIPNFDNFSWMSIVAAMGQMFYSLSIAMGILYTYGSYVKKDLDIEKSTRQIQVVDIAIAILSALIIIPAVFTYSGGDTSTLQAGPSLMFIIIPKIFASIEIGNIIGATFFLMILFAALTSAISLMETSISSFVDQTDWSRKKSCIIMTIIMLIMGVACSFGFGVWDFVQIMGMSILDFLDFLTNSVMMPIAALSTCILIVKVVSVKEIVKEVELSSDFKLKKLYNIFIKYLVPICLGIILISSISDAFGWINL